MTTENKHEKTTVTCYIGVKKMMAITGCKKITSVSVFGRGDERKIIIRGEE